MMLMWCYYSLYVCKLVDMTGIINMERIFHCHDGDYCRTCRNDDNNRVFDTNFY